MSIWTKGPLWAEVRTIDVIKVKLHPLTALQAQFTRFTSLREALFTCIWKRRQRQQTESVRKSIGNNILTEKSDRTTSLKAAPNGHSNSKNDAGAETKSQLSVGVSWANENSKQGRGSLCSLMSPGRALQLPPMPRSLLCILSPQVQAQLHAPGAPAEPNYGSASFPDA